MFKRISIAVRNLSLFSSSSSSTHGNSSGIKANSINTTTTTTTTTTHRPSFMSGKAYSHTHTHTHTPVYPNPNTQSKMASSSRQENNPADGERGESFTLKAGYTLPGQSAEADIRVLLPKGLSRADLEGFKPWSVCSSSFFLSASLFPPLFSPLLLLSLRAAFRSSLLLFFSFLFIVVGWCLMKNSHGSKPSSTHCRCKPMHLTRST